MKYVKPLILILIWSLLISCARKPATVVIKLLGSGRPKVEYSGPGIYTFSTLNDTFSLNVVSKGGNPLLSLSGKISVGNSNEVVTSFSSKSSSRYNVHFQGLSTTNDLNLPESNSFELIAVPAGINSYTNLLFIIYTYER